MARKVVASIQDSFERISDPRVNRGKNHDLLEMVFITICAVICGADGWADVERFGKSKREWLEQFLRLANGIPSHDTFGRVFSRLDTNEFYLCMSNWMHRFRKSLKGHGVAIDGKTLRGSFDTATGQSPLHLVSAWACDLRISLGQVAVDDKSNEITAVPKLLELLELTGAVVTLDAMHCQRETASAILKREADYVLIVKGNQPTLQAAIIDLFVAYSEQNFQVPGLRRHVTVERSHGRFERREYYVIAAPPGLSVLMGWPGLKSIGIVYRYRECNGKTQQETVCFISSLRPKVRLLAHHLRGHWKIENTLHWVLDVTFREDASRIRKDSAPEIASVFRRLAITLLQQDTTVKENIRGKRLRAGWNTTVLEGILAGLSGK
jgi:predicted transposase YbfD/YdcC